MSDQDPTDSEAASGGSEVDKFDDFHIAEPEEPARTVRRTVLGIAALVALLAGALIVYIASGTDEPRNDEPVEPTFPWTEYTPTWTETDQLDVYSVETVGDGRILARAVIGSGLGIMISENGTDWTQATVPDGVSPDFIDISGDRWLIAGEDTTRFPPAGNRAFYSDDGGEDWIELVLDEVGGDQSSMVLALVSGQNMVIAFEVGDDGQNSADGSSPDRQLIVYTSDGETTARTDEYLSRYTNGSSNAEGFYIVIVASEEEFLLTSADGFAWTETSTFDARQRDPESSGLRWLSHRDTWYIEGYTDETRVKSFDQIGDPESVTATIPVVSHLFSLDVGPTGMVAMAVSDSSQRELLLGLSRDGSDWEWQDPAEAFGVDGGQAGLGFAALEGYLSAPAVEFGVGSDFVLAKVIEFATGVDTDHPQVRATRWLKATLE